MEDFFMIIQFKYLDGYWTTLELVLREADHRMPVTSVRSIHLFVDRITHKRTFLALQHFFCLVVLNSFEGRDAE